MYYIFKNELYYKILIFIQKDINIYFLVFNFPSLVKPNPSQVSHL